MGQVKFQSMRLVENRVHSGPLNSGGIIAVTENGIVLSDSTTIKGTVISVASDNLGANTILGFVNFFS